MVELVFLKKMSQAKKTPYFLCLEPTLVEGLQLLSKHEGVTVTGIVEDALHSHLPTRIKRLGLKKPEPVKGEPDVHQTPKSK